jgi:hypothetical protein
MQYPVTQARGKKGAILLTCGAFVFLVSMAGLVIGYHYSWLITAPGLPDSVVPRYKVLAEAVGFSSLGLLALSLILIGTGLYCRLKRSSSSY